MKRRLPLQLLLLAQLGLVVVLVLHPLSAPAADGSLRVDFLDVGQGDAALVTMPNGVTLLIDGGGQTNFRSVANEDHEEEFVSDRRTIGEAVVSQFLWHRGYDSVDYVMPTHADADHIDGLNDVVKNFTVRAALVSRTPELDEQHSRLAATLVAENVPMLLIGRGDVLRFGDVTVEVLWPLFNSDVAAPSRNNDSLVLRLRFGERAILMTGDIESATETNLVRRNAVLRSDVVKVAHHGSRTSSSEGFVRAVEAEWAVVSVGQKSMFEHPHAEVLARWRTLGAIVLTTGTSGTITVRTDGKGLEVEEFVKNGR